jgi:hypothetical protein
MKKILLLLFALFTISTYSQEHIRIGLFQDGKLLVSDDDHNNTAPTLDLTLSVDLQGKQFNYYYFSIRSQIEYADLWSGELYRYSVVPMWNFNKLIIDKMEIGVGAGYSMISRDGFAWNSYSLVGEITYPISDNWKFGMRNEWVRRRDLQTPVLRYNLSFGIFYQFNK